MKQINLTMDGNGHIQQGACGGVIGDHNAAVMSITLDDPVSQAGYYRLFFAGENGTVMTEELFPSDGVICYMLPSEVTKLGHTALCQLCGFAGSGSNITLLFKSDSFPLTFGTSLPDTADIVSTGLTDRLTEMLDKVETFAASFDLQIGTVTTLASNASATAAVTGSDDMVFTLDLGIPKGEKGENSLTAGKRITIKDGVISADSSPIVYSGIANQYEYIGIGDSRTLDEMAGTLFFVDPIYENQSVNVPFFTSGEGVYYPLHCYNGTSPIDTVPNGAIQPGRLMAVYINKAGTPIYLNPYEKPENGLPIFTLTAGDLTSDFPQLTLSETDYSQFVGGKTIIAMATNDISFDGVCWYNPTMSPISVFNGSEWVGSETVTGKVIKAGQPVFLYVEYNTDYYLFDHFRLLNIPQ